MIRKKFQPKSKLHNAEHELHNAPIVAASVTVAKTVGGETSYTLSGSDVDVLGLIQLIDAIAHDRLRMNLALSAQAQTQAARAT